jgi:hypothetical protein
MTTDCIKVIGMCPEVEAGNFATLEHSILLNVGKGVEIKEILWKNSIIISKDV